MHKLIKSINKLEPRNFYLILSLILGFLFIFITPPFQTPDEVAHFYRAYSIFDGKIVVTDTPEGGGSEVPISFSETVKDLHEGIPFDYNSKVDYKDILNNLDRPLNLSEENYEDFYNTAVYTPISYLPQTLGIGFGAIFGLSPVVLMYLGRILNMLTGILIMYFGIKIAPFFKWIFVALGLMPMTLFLFGSLSADVMVISLSFYLTAYLLRLIYDKNIKKISIRDFIIITVVATLLSLSKQLYFLIPLVAILIPISKFKDIKWKLGFTLLPTVLSIIPSMLWSLSARKFYSGQEIIDNQIDIYIHNPLLFLKETFYEYTVNGWYLFEHFVGQLGWLDTRLPFFFVLLPATIMFILLLLSQKLPKDVYKLKSRIVYGGIFLGSVLLITLVVFIFWKSQTGGGVQGRYFIPIAPLAFLALVSDKINIEINIKNKKLYFLLFFMFLGLVSYVALFFRYYV